MPASELEMAHERYVSHFGPMNQRVTMADHTLTLIDAPGLVDEDHHRDQAGLSFTEWKPIRDGTVDFVEKLEGGTSDTGMIRTSTDKQLSEPISCHTVQPYSPLQTRGNRLWTITGTWHNTPGIWNWLPEPPWARCH